MHKRKTIEGPISITGKGVGYVEKFEIDPVSIKNAWSGDIVLAEVLSKDKARVKKIVKRTHPEVVGNVFVDKNRSYLMPDNRRLKKQINIDKPLEGKKAIVKIISWGGEFEHPQGEVVKILGEKGDHVVEMESILFDKGFDSSFPQDVEKEAQDIARREKPIPKEEVSSRKDFRKITTFTIDPDDAKDFDDALSYKELPNGNIEVGIHIADVSHYVNKGTKLDQVSRERGFSVYLVDRTIPMLPEVLSNDLCSLNPNEEKLAFSAVFEMDKNGKVKKEWFGKTVIESDKRFTYKEAQESINKGGLFSKELTVLNEIAKKIRKQREKEGAIDFETDEVKFELGKDYKPVKVYRKEHLDTHKLIEEYMLLANRHVGKFMSDAHKKRGGFIYRIHPEPDKEKLAQLGVFLRALGYEFNLEKSNLTSKDIAAILKKIEGKAEESLIKTAAVRSMAKAVYSTKNIGHFGLSFQYYTHFTSPIRRYPDLIVHRILWNHLNGKHVSSDEFALLSKISEESSSKEVSAAEAERESVKIKQVEYMADHVGSEFIGVVSGVTEWGLYIEDKNTKAEGMVRIKDLGDDYFELDQKTYSVVGRKTKKKFSLGDEVKFRVTGADVERKMLDFKVV
ncbi:MAG: ribonuclease R [Candidatus Pacebacteria bacterium]|nr:ribonuclease R [Candidatus Paceibacterota bacterium]